MKWLKMLLDMLKSIRKDMVEQDSKPDEEESKVEEPKVEEAINPEVTISDAKPTNDVGKDYDVWMTYKEV